MILGVSSGDPSLATGSVAVNELADQCEARSPCRRSPLHFADLVQDQDDGDAAGLRACGSRSNSLSMPAGDSNAVGSSRISTRASVTSARAISTAWRVSTGRSRMRRRVQVSTATSSEAFQMRSAQRLRELSGV